MIYANVLSQIKFNVKLILAVFTIHNMCYNVRM